MAWVLARCLRRSRMLSAWITRVSDMEAPSRSDWTTDMTNRYTSCTSHRLAISCMDRRRVMPIRTSRSIRRNSSIRGPSIRSTTFRMAPSSDRPAWTEMDSRSSTSGSCRIIFVCRFRMIWFSTPKGSMAPNSRHPQINTRPPKVLMGWPVVYRNPWNPQKIMETNQMPTRVRGFQIPCFPARMIRCSIIWGRAEGANLEKKSMAWASSRPMVRWYRGIFFRSLGLSSASWGFSSSRKVSSRRFTSSPWIFFRASTDRDR